MKARVLHFAAALALVTLGTACESGDKKAKSDATAVGSAKPKSNLEKALESAAAATATAAAQAPGQGPPANGVFAAAVADAEQPANAPPKVTLVKAGDDPKVKLGAGGLAAGTRLSVTVSAAAFQGPLPAMVFALEVAGDGSATAEDAARRSAVVFQVKKAEVDPNWQGKLQAGGDKLLAKLAGTKVRAALGADGGLTSVSVDAPKDVKDIAYIAETMAQALAFVFVPQPAEPVGVGASWLVADRTSVSGMPLLRYRAVTVQSLKGDDLVLGIDVRHYAPSPTALPEGLPAGVETLRLESFGQSTLARKVNDVTPVGAKIGWPVDLVVGKGGQPAGKLHAEVMAEVHAASGDAKKP